MDNKDDDIREFIKEYREEKKASQRAWNITALISTVIIVFLAVNVHKDNRELERNHKEILEIAEGE